MISPTPIGLRRPGLPRCRPRHCRIHCGEYPKYISRSEANQEAVIAKIDPIDIQILQQQLQAVRNLPRIVDDVVLDGRPREDPLLDDENREPSFKRLFTHETWGRYTGKRAWVRWLRVLTQWRFSFISKEIFPIVCSVALWAFSVASLLPRAAPAIAARASQMWIPLSLQGTAIGLLLVFRTNNAYLRLAEAREQWGKLLMLVREVSTKVSVSLPYDVVAEVCRYLCAFTWSLRDKLRDGEVRDDILNTLLGPEEARWVTSQRSRPLAILSRLRRLVYAEYSSGALDAQLFYFLEVDIKEMDTVVESCERLFSSPIPPNMARHGMRSLTLWLCALPVVLTSSMPPVLVGLWTAITSYIYLGVDELGAQVEQPFAIMPLWQLCHLAQLNVEESLSTPDLPLRLNRMSEAIPNPNECQSGIPFKG